MSSSSDACLKFFTRDISGFYFEIYNFLSTSNLFIVEVSEFLI